MPPLDLPRNTSKRTPSIENVGIIGTILLAEIFLTTIPRIKTKERSQTIVSGKHSMQLMNSSNMINGSELNKYKINIGRGILSINLAILFLHTKVRMNAADKIITSGIKPNTMYIIDVGGYRELRGLYYILSAVL